MLTSDHQVLDGQVLKIELSDGGGPPITLEITARSYRKVQAAWKQLERAQGERIPAERFFELLPEPFLQRRGHEQRELSCSMCGGPCLE